MDGKGITVTWKDGTKDTLEDLVRAERLRELEVEARDAARVESRRFSYARGRTGLRKHKVFAPEERSGAISSRQYSRREVMALNLEGKPIVWRIIDAVLDPAHLGVWRRGRELYELFESQGDPRSSISVNLSQVTKWLEEMGHMKRRRIPKTNSFEYKLIGIEYDETMESLGAMHREYLVWNRARRGRRGRDWDGLVTPPLSEEEEKEKLEEEEKARWEESAKTAGEILEDAEKERLKYADEEASKGIQYADPSGTACPGIPKEMSVNVNVSGRVELVFKLEV